MKRIWIVLASLLFLTGCTLFPTSTTSETTAPTSATTETTTLSTLIRIPEMVLYEVYGGGGNVGAVYRNDYVVLYNPSEDSFDLSLCSLQYSPATGTSFSVFPLSGTIQGESYFLISLYGGTNGVPLPVSFGESFSLNLAATAAKVALVFGQEPITGPTNAAVLDFLGYGSTANLSEGSPTGNLSATVSAKRNGTGDTGDNSADFILGTPDLGYVLDSLEMTGISLSGWDDFYAVGDSLNLSGAVVVGEYSHGETSRITPDSGMVSGFDTSVSGNFSLTVTYESFTASLSYTVVDVDPDAVLSVSYIDIGMGGGGPGESTLIEIGDIDVLVDSGENTSEATDELLAFLSDHVTDGTIEYLIATHQDSDHIGGFTEVMDAFVVQNAIIYSTPESIATSLRRTFENRLVAEGASVVRILDLVNSADPTVSLGEGVDLRFYDTGYLTATTANASCMVFVLEAYGTRILFTGDAESDQESVYAPEVGDVDIFKMGHHGSANGTSTKLLENITPEVAIVSNGDLLGNEYGHPTYAAVGRIYAYSSDIPVYAVTGGNGNETGIPITWQRNGTITVTVTPAGYSIASEYYGSSPMELSQTDYWKDSSNPNSDLGYIHTSVLPSIGNGTLFSLPFVVFGSLKFITKDRANA